MTDSDFRDMMLRVFAIAGLAFGAGSTFLYFFIKSLGDSDTPKEGQTRPLVRFVILVVTLAAFAMLFMWMSYE